MGASSQHEGDALRLRHVLSALPQHLSTPEEVGGLGAAETRNSTEVWRGSLSSVSSIWSHQTRAATVRESRRGKFLTMLRIRRRSKSRSPSPTNSFRSKKVGTLRRTVKFATKFSRRNKGAIAQYVNTSVPQDVGGLLGNLDLQDVIQNGHFSISRVETPMIDQPDAIHDNNDVVMEKNAEHEAPSGARTSNNDDAAVIHSVKYDELPEADANDNNDAGMGKNAKYEELCEAGASDSHDAAMAKNHKFDDLFEARGDKHLKKAYAAMRGEKYSSKGSLYDIPFADSKPEDDSEDVRVRYDEPENEKNVLEDFALYDHVPSEPFVAADRKPRTKASLVNMTGYVQIGSQIVDPDSLHDTNRAARGLPAEQWEGSKTIAQMENSPRDSNKEIIRDDEDHDVEVDIEGQAQVEASSTADNKDLTLVEHESTTVAACEPQESALKSRRPILKKRSASEPTPQRSLDEFSTTDSSDSDWPNQPHQRLITDEMFMELATGAKRVEQRSTTHVERKTHKAVFNATRDGPKGASRREDILDAIMKKDEVKDLNDGGNLSNYSVETWPSPKKTDEGQDLRRIPKMLNRNQGAPLMRPGDASGIQYEGRRRSIQKLPRSESLRSQFVEADRPALSRSPSKVRFVSGGGSLYRPGLDGPTATATAAIQDPFQDPEYELPESVNGDVPEVDLLLDDMFKLMHQKLDNEYTKLIAAMDADINAAYSEVMVPEHFMLHITEDALKDQARSLELRNYRTTILDAVHQWRVEKLRVSVQWKASRSSYNGYRKVIARRLKEVEDKLAEVDKRIAEADEKYKERKDRLRTIQWKMIADVHDTWKSHDHMTAEQYAAYQQQFASPPVIIRSINDGARSSPQPYPQADPLFSRHNLQAVQQNGSLHLYQSSPAPNGGQLPHGHPLQQPHSSPYMQAPMGGQPHIFSSPNNGMAQPTQRSSSPRPAFVQPAFVPALEPIPSIAPGDHASQTPSQQQPRHSSGPAYGPPSGFEQQKHRQHEYRGVVAGPPRNYRRPPPPPPMMTPARGVDMCWQRNTAPPRHYTGGHRFGGPHPAPSQPRDGEMEEGQEMDRRGSLYYSCLEQDSDEDAEEEAALALEKERLEASKLAFAEARRLRLENETEEEREEREMEEEIEREERRDMEEARRLYDEEDE